MNNINNKKTETEINPAVKKIVKILELTESEILKLKIKEETN
jgi:hypothetical protein